MTSKGLCYRQSPEGHDFIPEFSNCRRDLFRTIPPVNRPLKQKARPGAKPFILVVPEKREAYNFP
jgi:hypothetical protein